jgi:integrase
MRRESNQGWQGAEAGPTSRPSQRDVIPGYSGVHAQAVDRSPTKALVPSKSPVLTVARTDEIQNMRWSQLDLDHGPWDIIGAGVETAAPGEMEDGTRAKNNNSKPTPLQRQALAILREMYEKRVIEYAFPGRELDGPMSNNTMLKALKEFQVTRP